MLLVSGATKTMARIGNDPRLGVLLRPGNGNRPGARPWAVDNGAYSKKHSFDPDAFWSLLLRVQGHPGCLWVVAPDVVADSAQTRQLFRAWEPLLHGAGFPVAFVSQDGERSPPWDHLECLFIGGTDEHKLGTEAMALAHEAKRRGKLVHMGRVNSVKRATLAHYNGADSIDGTQCSMFPDRWIPWTLTRLRGIDSQRYLFGPPWERS